MAEICLTYLNSGQQVKVLLADPSPKHQDTPFLKYCPIYWGVHAKRELSDCAKLLALKLFKEYDGHIYTRLLLKQVKLLYGQDWQSFSSFTGLHCASFFGIAELAAALIEGECCDVNKGDFLGYTPLAWAAQNGPKTVARMPLGRKEIGPGKLDNGGRTPFPHAAWNGHAEMVKILPRQQDVNPNKPGDEGRTPLSH
ncbi:ankyrin, partial [Choiromyces venosus 120613-1]